VAPGSVVGRSRDMAQRRANSPTLRNFRQTRRRTTANPSTDGTAASHFDLFRASVRRGCEGDFRLGVDHSLFLTRCRCHSGPRSRAYGRTDQSALSTKLGQMRSRITNSPISFGPNPHSSHHGIDPRPLRCRSSRRVSGEVAGGGCAL